MNKAAVAPLIPAATTVRLPKNANPRLASAQSKASAANGSASTFLFLTGPNNCGWSSVVPAASCTPVKLATFCPLQETVINGKRKHRMLPINNAGEIFALCAICSILLCLLLGKGRRVFARRRQCRPRHYFNFRFVPTGQEIQPPRNSVSMSWLFPYADPDRLAFDCI